MSTEAELAARAMRTLQLCGWEVWPEVAPWGGGSKRCDIVAVRAPVIMAVEVKPRLNTKVLWQAAEWQGFAHYLVAAVGHSSSLGDPVLGAFARSHGIGVMRVPESPDDLAVAPGRVRWRHDDIFQIAPRLHRRLHNPFTKHLHEDQRQYDPGTPHGFSTPWSRTMDSAVSAIKTAPGLTVREIVAAIEHHYQRDTTARSSLVMWLQKDGRVEARKEGNGFRFYPRQVA